MPNIKPLIYILAGLVIFTGYDIISDIHAGNTFVHIFEELTIVALSLSAVYILFRWSKNQQNELIQLSSDLESSKKIMQQQSTEMENARQQYSLVISNQFSEWNLTQSEKETAYAILKGLSFKEIAAVRNVKEKTVRQQASGVYAKANIEGRHSLSAWFFEDFFNE